MGKRQPFQYGVGKTGHSYMQRIKLDYFITLHTKINSKWTKDLNVRPETINIGLWFHKP